MNAFDTGTPPSLSSLYCWPLSFLLGLNVPLVSYKWFHWHLSRLAILIGNKYGKEMWRHALSSSVFDLRLSANSCYLFVGPSSDQCPFFYSISSDKNQSMMMNRFRWLLYWLYGLLVAELTPGSQIDTVSENSSQSCRLTTHSGQSLYMKKFLKYRKRWTFFL